MGNLVSSVRIRYELLRSAAFGEITTGYLAIGLPFSNPIRLIRVTNDTDANILVSLNGIDDHDIAPANSFYLYDYATNRADAAGLLEQPQGDRVYIKAETSLPTEGKVYLTSFYASQV